MCQSAAASRKILLNCRADNYATRRISRLLFTVIFVTTRAASSTNATTKAASAIETNLDSNGSGPAAVPSTEQWGNHGRGHLRNTGDAVESWRGRLMRSFSLGHASRLASASVLGRDVVEESGRRGLLRRERKRFGLSKEVLSSSSELDSRLLEIAARSLEPQETPSSVPCTRCTNLTVPSTVKEMKPRKFEHVARPPPRHGRLLNSSSTIQVGEPQVGVCRWRPLSHCSPTASLKEVGDKLCSETIAPSETGFCDCDGDTKVGMTEQQFGCGTSPNRCDDVCTVCKPLVTVQAALRADKRFWRQYCHKVPVSTIALRLTMGSTEDYFKPLSGSSWCDMLMSNDKHEWSKDMRMWLQPTPLNVTGLFGGSLLHPGQGWVDDTRTRISFWGSDIRTGGCCASAYDDTTNQLEWGQAFVFASCEAY